jgi:hypothetical protein
MKLLVVVNLTLATVVECNVPGGRQLNPFIDYSDPFNLRQGNPYLLPEFTGSYEVGYTHILKKGKTLNANVYFRDKSNLITWFSQVDTNGINTTTHKNLNNGEDAGMDFSFRGRIGTKGAFCNAWRKLLLQPGQR